MRIIVCGSRDWSDWDRLKEALWLMDGKRENGVWRYPQLDIIHGGCPTGADAMAKRYCSLSGCHESVFPADWSRGRKAGPERNEAMAGLSGVGLCLAFWDGVSRGTLDMVTRAVKHGIPVRIVPKATT